MSGRRWGILVAIFGFLAGGLPAAADETFEPISGVAILDATATTSLVDGTARLRFGLENFSSSDVTLIGVRSENAGSGTVILTDGSGGQSVALQLLVRQEESLDLSSSHIRIELRGLNKPLSEGDVMPFELLFRQGSATGFAHVHAAGR